MAEEEKNPSTTESETVDSDSKTPDKPTEKVSEDVKPKSGNKTLVIVLVIVGVLIVISGISYYAFSKYISNKLSEGIAEDILSTATGGAVDYDSNSGNVTIKSDEGTYQYGETTEWPSDMPSVVPKFTYGNISYSSKYDTDGNTGWSIAFTDVDSDAADAYRSDLTAKGWTGEDSVSVDSLQTFTMENGQWEIYVMVDNSSNEASITVSQVTETTEQ